MLRTILVGVLAAVLLSGCSLRLPGIGIDIGDPGHDHGHGEFCPPGQAKKGNC